MSKFFKVIRSCHQRLRVRYFKLFSDNTYKGTPWLNQPVLFKGNGKIFFEPKVQLGFKESPFFYNGYMYFEAKGKESEIKIGGNTIINNNASIMADHATIRIGKNVLIGLSFEVSTDDGHNLDPNKRLSPDYAKMNVTIGDNVFVGSNVIVLKGVSIGRNSVIGNGSIVTRSIPKNVVAAGIPCRIIRKLPNQ